MYISGTHFAVLPVKTKLGPSNVHSAVPAHWLPAPIQSCSLWNSVYLVTKCNLLGNPDILFSWAHVTHIMFAVMSLLSLSTYHPTLFIVSFLNSQWIFCEIFSVWVKDFYFNRKVLKIFITWIFCDIKLFSLIYIFC